VIVGLLLAAGGARRFGSQKLVARLDGVPIVRRAFDSLAAATDAVMVVVGSESEAVARALEGSAAILFENRDWASGLSTSIRAGIFAMPRKAEAVIVGLGDEPTIDAEVCRELVRVWRRDETLIVAARYNGVQDHPVLFDRAVFDELTSLAGDVGAKSVINRVPERVAFVDVSAPQPIDVDEPDDLPAARGQMPDTSGKPPENSDSGFM
jgi:molybdenum cofactor cytidylyltransferase